MNILGDSGMCRLFLDHFYRKRFVLLAISGIAVMSTSCEDKEIVAVNSGNSLSAVKIYQTAGRTASSSAYFEEGTCYRIWAYHNGGDEDGKYVFSSGNGILGTESHSHYIDMTSDNNAKLRGNLHVYGFTDGTKTAPEPEAGSTVDRPVYKVEYNGSETPAGKSTVNYIFPDYMRANLEYDGNSDMPYSVLEFRHIMSQISVEVLQQYVREGDDEVALYQDLRVTDIAVKGVYDKAEYDVIDDKMTIDKSGGKQTHVIWKSKAEKGEDIGIYAEETVRTLLLPTEEGDSEGISLVLTIEGKDAGLFLGSNATSGTVEVPVMDNNDITKALAFKPNFSYILQVTFIDGKVRVVTSLPDVYPWFDGEITETEEGDLPFQEQDLGAPQLFDGLLWSAYNIGADKSHPTDEDEFIKSMGFFYQSDRNIPFFPTDKYTGNLMDWGDKRVFPVVIQNPDEYKPGTSYTRLYTAPQRAFSKSISEAVDRLDNLYAEVNSGKFAGYIGNWGLTADPKLVRHGQTLWNKVQTQPSPPGWRMPTTADFLAIMPSTPHAGNITFIQDFTYVKSGDVGSNGSDIMAEKVVYVHVPVKSEKDYTGTYKKGSSPLEFNSHVPQSYDPAPGYESEYVISKKYGASDFVGKPVVKLYNNNFGGNHLDDAEWGCIYGIKKVGTQEAYRMRWRVQGLSKTRNCYVLVVERYPATSSDRLLYDENDVNNPHYYRNYDWNHPVAQLYFPIVGLIGDYYWNSGIWSLYGVETILATSDKTTDGSYVTLRIKIGGDQRKNQSISITSDREGTGSQIRCVRDYDYEQDMAFENRQPAKNGKNKSRGGRR